MVDRVHETASARVKRRSPRDEQRPHALGGDFAEQERREKSPQALAEQERARLEASAAKLNEAEERIEALRRELDGERRKAAAMRRAVDESLDELRGLSALQDGMQGALAEAERRAALGAGFERELALERQASEAIAAEARAREAVLAAELGGESGKAAALETKAAALQNALAKAEDELLSGRREVGELQARFSPKLQRLVELEGDHESLTRNYAAAQNELARERERGEELSQDLARGGSQLAEQSQIIEHLRAQLVEMEERRLSQALARAGAERRIDAQCGEIDALHERAEQAELQLTDRAAALAAERRLNEQRGLEIAAIKRSRTWRMGAPLRAIGRGLSRLSGARLARKHANPLFDAAYYLEKYPDVIISGLDPYAHYLRHGASEGRDPNPMFDTRWYLETYPDVRDQGLNPLMHYYLHGAAEGRDPHPLFSTAWYLEQRPELAERNVNALEHYLQSLETSE
jgi:chromosome segregation ATPase